MGVSQAGCQGCLVVTLAAGLVLQRCVLIKRLLCGVQWREGPQV